MAAMNGLDTSGIQTIVTALNTYQKDLAAIAKSGGAFYSLTSKSIDARDYFAKSQAMSNFTKETDAVFNELNSANTKLLQYVQEFQQVSQNYRQFADQSANAVASSMKS